MLLEKNGIKNKVQFLVLGIRPLDVVIWDRGVQEIKTLNMKQHYKKYTKEDFAVWKLLFQRQRKELEDKSCDEYLSCLETLGKNLWENDIPDFESLDKFLLEKTGWSIEVVPGLIPDIDFFELLSKKRFCSSTWLRKMSQLDYLEEPDMFHDIFGHIPLLVDKNYADYMQKIGFLGVQFRNNPEIIQSLRSLYWFTIEFGLLGDPKDPKIYGAGIISSYGESKHIYENSEVVIKEFDIKEILEKEIITSEIQTFYYTIESLDFLYASIDITTKFLEEREIKITS